MMYTAKDLNAIAHAAKEARRLHVQENIIKPWLESFKKCCKDAASKGDFKYVTRSIPWENLNIQNNEEKEMFRQAAELHLMERQFPFFSVDICAKTFSVGALWRDEDVEGK